MQAKKKPKADINRNSFIYFQIGLIIVLGLSYLGIEWKFTKTESAPAYEIVVIDIEFEDIPVAQINELPLPPPVP